MKCFFAGLFCLITMTTCSAEPHLSLSGLLDARFIVADDVLSWLDGGLGKTRYGSEEVVGLARLSQASLLVTASANDQLSARLHLNIDAEPVGIQTGSRIDVIEGFASYRPVLSPKMRLRVKGGLFFPPVSLENRAIAWSSAFSITPSAINSWIGEEVRVTGAETGLIFSHDSTEYSFSGAIFGNNDPAGTLLAWRGWALHDRQTGLTDRVPLDEIPALQPDGLFPQQPDFVEPFREVDGRAGFYTFAGIRNRTLELNATYYNNRGQSTKFDGVQYAWHTDFTNVGLDVPIKEHFEFLSQFLTGRSKMGIGDMVNIHFYSFYFLGSAEFEPFRFTVRYDDFRVQDRDAYQAQDDNNESGYAWTFAWMMKVLEKHRIAVELLHVHSERVVTKSEWQLQTSFRFRF